MLSEVITQEHIESAFDGIETIFSIYGPHAATAMGVITLAFSTDPVARWMYPDPNEFLTHFPKFIRAFAGKSFEHGSAYLAPKATGAALWLLPEVEPEEDPLIELFWLTTSDEVQKDLFPVFEQMGVLHPKEPHWYLPMIGVETHQQGRGIGASLMQHALSNCDNNRLPAYLESSNPRNISLYERFGFEVMGTIQIGNSPPLYPMYRKPR